MTRLPALALSAILAISGPSILRATSSTGGSLVPVHHSPPVREHSGSRSSCEPSAAACWAAAIALAMLLSVLPHRAEVDAAVTWIVFMMSTILSFHHEEHEDHEGG